jgi:hypothetical protein
MNKLNREYFNNHCYFNIEVVGDKINLTYDVYSTLKEEKKDGEKREFKKKNYDKLNKTINKFVKSNRKVSKKEIENDLDSVEIDEYVDSDGTLLTTKTPILNMTLHPTKTMDAQVRMQRAYGNPFRRVFYGESEEKNDDVINEIDFSDAFGYHETKNAKSYDEAKNILMDLGIEDEVELSERLKTLGFERKLDKSLKVQKKRGNCKNCFVKKRLTEKEYLEEVKKEKMVKMVEDILTKKRNDREIMEKENENSSLSKLITKNLESIKNLAKKEGISINKLINILKQGE